jgi:hypothetical protein
MGSPSTPTVRTTTTAGYQSLTAAATPASMLDSASADLASAAVAVLPTSSSSALTHA